MSSTAPVILFNRDPGFTLLTAGVSLLFVFILGKIIAELRNPLNRIPGPWYARFTDWVLLVYTLRGEQLYYLQDLARKYGPVARASPKSVVLGDPNDIRDVVTDGRAFGKSEWYQDRGGFNGLINTRDLKAHGALRRLFARGFSNSEIRKLEALVRGRVTLAMRQMRDESAEHGHADVLKWFSFMATDVISELCFGESMHMLEKGKKDEYITTLQNGLLTTFLQYDLTPLYWLLKLVPGSVANRSNNERFSSFQIYRVERLREKLRSAEGDLTATFFKDILLQEKQAGLNDHEVIGLANELIFTGSDTTSNTLSWLVWAVLKNPSARRKLCDEVAKLPHDYSISALEELPYLNAVLDETLRLYGSVSGDLPRQVWKPEGHTFHNGVFVPHGTNLEVQSHNMHCSSTVFPNPEKFNPDRWLNATPQMRACFTPFGGGVRICLGIHLAMIEIRLVIAEFFRAYPNAEVADLTKDDDMRRRNFTVNVPKGGAVYVKL
ncbi:cytochrome P450 [Biscogniauxia marginata]|nr:cytochrome P450 [Biscogniauxia marginata]